MPRVAIVYRFIPHYRKPFYEGLRKKLADRGIELDVYYGRSDPAEAEKRDSVDLDWGRQVENLVVRLPNGPRLYWQRCFRRLLGYDMVIAEQASKLLINYPLLLAQYLNGPRLGLWGHGRNYQAHRASELGERLKAFLTRRPAWFFAYTEGSAEAVRAAGLPPERITVVQNAIDTEVLEKVRASLTLEETLDLRRQLGLQGENVALYVGGMYPDKRLEFLIAASSLVREKVHDFELILLGGGPSSHLAEQASARHPWVHWLGPQFDRTKVACFEVSKLLLMPGLVGLAVLDSFVLETPLVTTAVDFHSPEIEYLEDGENGLIVSPPDSERAYADAIVRLLTEEEALQHLVEGCRHSKPRYTMGNMVARFADGIVACLASPRPRPFRK